MVQSQTAIFKKEIKDIVAQIVASEMPATERYKWGFAFLNNPQLQDINDALKYIQEAANDGIVAAQFFLAKLRFDGEYIEQNYAKAWSDFRKVANSNYTEAQYYLGLYHYKGIDTAVNYGLAFEKFKMALPLGMPHILHTIAECYENGRGTVKDPEIAYEYYKQSADNGHISSQLKVAELLEAGIGCKANPKEALRWLEIAGGKGSGEALYKLSNHHKQNTATCVKYLTLAANAGYPAAQYELGIRCINGDGLPKNPGTGLELIGNAALLDYPDAALYTGIAFLEGKITTKNLEQSKWFLDKAQQLGARNASEYLAKATAELEASQRAGVTHEETEALENSKLVKQTLSMREARAAAQKELEEAAALEQAQLIKNVLSMSGVRAEARTQAEEAATLGQAQQIKSALSMKAARAQAQVQAQESEMMEQAQKVKEALRMKAARFAAQRQSEEEQLLLQARRVKEALRTNMQMRKSDQTALDDDSKIAQSMLADFNATLKKAEAGDLSAQFDVGVTYIKGKRQGVLVVVQPNIHEAQKWLQLTVAGGNTDAVPILTQITQAIEQMEGIVNSL